MASTSRASRKTVEDAEIFQVLEESTDSDVTICKQCDLPLCRVGCFLEYHQQRNVEVQN